MPPKSVNVLSTANTMLSLGSSEQKPSPDTVQNRQRHCADQGCRDAVNVKIVEQRARQEQQEGINHKDEQPKAQQHGNKDMVKNNFPDCLSRSILATCYRVAPGSRSAVWKRIQQMSNGK